MSAFANLRQMSAPGRCACPTATSAPSGSGWRRAPGSWRSGLLTTIVCVIGLAVTYFTFARSARSRRRTARSARRSARSASITTSTSTRRPATPCRSSASATIRRSSPADLEAAAKGENVQIAESNERPAAPAGASRRYLQHDLDIKLREVDLQSLTKFMRRVETGPRFIFFTRISLKHRYSETDKLDAELTATAFEKVKDDKKKKAEAAKAAGKKE